MRDKLAVVFAFPLDVVSTPLHCRGDHELEQRCRGEHELEQLRLHVTEGIVDTTGGAQTSFLTAIDPHAKLMSTPNDSKAKKIIVFGPADVLVASEDLAATRKGKVLPRKRARRLQLHGISLPKTESACECP